MSDGFLPWRRRVFGVGLLLSALFVLESHLSTDLVLSGPQPPSRLPERPLAVGQVVAELSYASVCAPEFFFGRRLVLHGGEATAGGASFVGQRLFRGAE